MKFDVIVRPSEGKFGALWTGDVATFSLFKVGYSQTIELTKGAIVSLQTNILYLLQAKVGPSPAATMCIAFYDGSNIWVVGDEDLVYVRTTVRGFATNSQVVYSGPLVGSLTFDRCTSEGLTIEDLSFFLTHAGSGYADIKGYGNITFNPNGLNTALNYTRPNGQTQNIEFTEPTAFQVASGTATSTPPELYFADSNDAQAKLHVPMASPNSTVVDGESSSVSIPDSALIELPTFKAPEITIQYTNTTTPAVTDTPTARSKNRKR